MPDPENTLQEEEGARFNLISFDTLNMNRFSFKNPPETDGIIIKTVFVPNEETGRRFPQKTFFHYKAAKSLKENRKVTKKEATFLLLEPLIDYLKIKKLRPKGTEFIEKSKTKAGKVKYEIKFSQYESFIMAFEPIMFPASNDDVSLYINSIPIDPEDLNKPSQGDTPWKIEYAKSSRAKCRKCSEKIMKEDLRIGEPSFYDGHISYRWYHKHCVFDLKGKTIEESNDLRDEEKTFILNLQSENISHSTLPLRVLIISLIQKYTDPEGITLLSDIFLFGKEKLLEKAQIEKELQNMESEGLIYFPSPEKVRYFT